MNDSLAFNGFILANNNNRLIHVIYIYIYIYIHTYMHTHTHTHIHRGSVNHKLLYVVYICKYLLAADKLIIL